VADGHLGIGAALREVGCGGAAHRCWQHKRANVIAQLPKQPWPEARELLRKLPYAESEKACARRRDACAARYRTGYPKAVETLCRDWARMVTCYRFPKEHGTHLRTTTPVASPFAAVRLRTDAATRFKKVANAEALIWQIRVIAQKKCRRLNSPQLLEVVHRGQKCVDGKPVKETCRMCPAA
jgi:transposase-like protein